MRVAIDLENEGGCPTIDRERTCDSKWFPGRNIGLDLLVRNVWREADVRARNTANRGLSSAAHAGSVIDHPEPRVQDAGSTAHGLPALDGKLRSVGFAMRPPFQLKERVAANHDSVDCFTVDQTTDNCLSLGPSKQLHGFGGRNVSRRSQHRILIDGGINQHWLNACCAQRRKPRR